MCCLNTRKQSISNYRKVVGSVMFPRNFIKYYGRFFSMFLALVDFAFASNISLFFAKFACRLSPQERHRFWKQVLGNIGFFT